MEVVTIDEVKKHCRRDSCWIILDELVYDVTNWLNKHPGGARIIGHYGGQDASDAWKAMHAMRGYASKFLGSYLIGRLKSNGSSEMDSNSEMEIKLRKNEEMLKDFRALRQQIEEAGLMKAQFSFFFFHFIHIIVIEIVAYVLMKSNMESVLSFLLVAFLLATSQAQSGWTQHDYGHTSVFNRSNLNRIMHYITICHLKGASSHWWNFRHFQHHVKPNVIRKDPDVAMAELFLLGDALPRSWGSRKRGKMPYNYQHWYFWLSPPLLLPIYFHLENVYFVIKRRDWVDLFWMVTFFFRFFYFYGSVLGGWKALGLYMLMRFIESYWFVLVTQMNHIPMEVDADLNEDWVTLQFKATCNIEGSLFNDWFTGGLNYQIEHHLYPTMPRHNLPKVAPMIREFASKHNLVYVEKSLMDGILDIHRSLRRSGQLWLDAYSSLE